MGLLDIFKPAAAPALPAPETRVDAAPQGRRVTQYVRSDSLVNPITGFGILGSDRRMGARYDQRQPLVLTEQYWLYKQTWLAAVICECVPQHCARAWFTVKVKGKPEATEALQKRLDKRRGDFKWAATLANMTGGGLLALGIDDGLPPNMPLNLKRIRRLIWARPFDRWYAYPSARVEDPFDERFGEPAQYSVFGQAFSYINDPEAKAAGIFDASRTLRFDGNLLPELLRQANQGWNDSVLERVYDALRDFNQGTDAGAKTLTDFTLTILKVVGFSQDQLNTGGEALAQRVATFSQTQATAGTMAIDSTEEVERIGHKLNGFSDLLEILLEQVAGSAGIPRVILYGQAGGVSRAGADTDIRSFYDRVLDVLGTDWKPKAMRVCEIEAASAEMRAFGIKPDEIELECGSLWEEEPKTTAEILKLRADALAALNGLGAMMPEQMHRAAVDTLNDGGLAAEVDEAFVADLAAAQIDPEAPPSAGSQYTGAMPPLAGRNGQGMPIIPDVNSNAAGGA